MNFTSGVYLIGAAVFAVYIVVVIAYIVAEGRATRWWRRPRAQ